MRPVTHVLLGIALLTCTGAAAASFDCEKVSRPLEKLICTDDQLSKLDERMAEIFSESMQPLSMMGKETLRSGQESWLRFLRTVCSTPDPHRAKNCVAYGYKSRIEDLKTVGVRAGPIVLNRRDDYWALKDDEDDTTGEYQGYFSSHIATLLIDEPVKTSFRLWDKENELNKGQGYCDGPHNDYERNFWIAFASSRLLVIKYGDSWYCHGALHGTHSGQQAAFIPEIPPRKVELRDLFGDTGPGVQYLEERMRSHLSDDIKRSFQMHFGPVPAESIRITVTSIGPTKDGLEISHRFGYRNVESIVPPMTMPWREIRPFLIHDSPIPSEWLQ